MPVKIIDVPEVGKVSFYKRRGSKSMRLSITGEGVIRVTLPSWVPYRTGMAFVHQKQNWIASHKNVQPKLLYNGQRIGKAHRLQFIKSEASKIASRLSGTEARVYYPHTLSADDSAVQAVAHRTALKALRQEAGTLLPQRLKVMADQTGFNYNSVKVRHLKSRWGSCTSKQDITLNYFLMLLAWEVIDYVLLHELVHTQHLNHSKDFWLTVEKLMPDYKKRRKVLKTYQPNILSNLASLELP